MNKNRARQRIALFASLLAFYGHSRPFEGYPTSYFSCDDNEERWMSDRAFEECHERWFEEEGYAAFISACGGEEDSLELIRIPQKYADEIVDTYRRLNMCNSELKQRANNKRTALLAELDCLKTFNFELNEAIEPQVVRCTYAAKKKIEIAERNGFSSGSASTDVYQYLNDRYKNDFCADNAVHAYVEFVHVPVEQFAMYVHAINRYERIEDCVLEYGDMCDKAKAFIKDAIQVHLHVWKDDQSGLDQSFAHCYN